MIREYRILKQNGEIYALARADAKYEDKDFWGCDNVSKNAPIRYYTEGKKSNTVSVVIATTNDNLKDVPELTDSFLKKGNSLKEGESIRIKIHPGDHSGKTISQILEFIKNNKDKKKWHEQKESNKKL